MSERTCELDGKFFEGVPANWDAESLCQGCAGDDDPDVCAALADCAPGNVIWIAAARKEQHEAG